MSDQALHILQSVFGYDAFRAQQGEIIDNILHRRDTVAIMPTGGGKSLCYQIPALIFEGLTLVISPLISLMEDQVDQLTSLGICAALLNSTLSSSDYHDTLAKVRNGQLKLLYMAPETLMLERTRQVLSSVRIDCLTIDEAHCISEWGHDFRPEYRQLADVRQTLPDAVCVALTATATPRVQQDIKGILQMSEANAFVASFDRPNLFLEVIEKQSPVNQIVQLISKYADQSGIIYCNSRRQVDELTQTLARRGCSVAPYHAGLSSEERKANQRAFIRDDVLIMVATVAFGMGINKSNVRYVLHFDLPQNIESYYQQIGRAGRDGLPAFCHFLFGYGDIQKVKFFINKKSESEQRVASQHLNALIGYAESEECRRGPLLHYFGENYSRENCQQCDNCGSQQQPLSDVTIPAQKFLSCIFRTGQLFGAAYLIDVLRGSKAQKILARRHDQITTYGIGTELTKPQWQQLARKLLQEDLITQDPDYGSLKLARSARAVLKGERAVLMRLTQRPEFTAEKFTAKKSAEQATPDCHQALFERLRHCRKALADRENMPPYVIFSDKTLIDMASRLPQDRDELLQISGVGQVKLSHYGDAFLHEITTFCQEQGVQGTISPELKREQPLGRHVQVGELFVQLNCLDRMQSELKIQQATMLSHLYKYQTQVAPLPRTDAFINQSSLLPAQQEEVLDAMSLLGTERLRPVYEQLCERVCYHELHLLRLHYLIHQTAGSVTGGQ